MGSTSCIGCGASLSGVATPAAGYTPTPVAQPSVARRGISGQVPATIAPNGGIPASASPQAVQASGPGNISALQPFGWRSIAGKVIHVEPIHLGVPDSRWGMLLLKLAAVGAAIYYFGLVVLMGIGALWVLTWLLSKILPHGFIGTIATQVVSFMLTRRLIGPVPSVPIRDFRLRDAGGKETLVRIKGTLTSGSVAVGDDVQVEGWERDGMLNFRRGFNSRIQAVLRAKIQ